MPSLNKFADVVLAAIAVILVLATVAAFFARVHWICDTLANLRIQGLIAIASILVVSAMLRRWRITLVLSLLLLLNLNGMNLGTTTQPVNHLAGDSTNAVIQKSIRVVTTNVLALNANHDAIIEELRTLDADVIAVIELTPQLARRLRATFATTHPYQTFHDRDDNNFGIGILSRLPILSTETLRWPGTPISLEANLGDVRLIATHPYPPIGQANFHSRNRQLTQLSEHIRNTRDKNRGTVLLGDFNLTPWNANFTDLLTTSGLKRAAGRWEFHPTWFARPWFALGLLIDHILISDDLTCTEYSIGEDCGSDHRSVLVTLAATNE